MDDIGRIQQRFAAFVETTRRRAPLYASLSERISGNPAVARPLLSAERSQQQPVMLFAAVHSSLMARPDPRLSSHYRTLGGRTPSEPAQFEAAWSALVHLLSDRREEIESIIATRRVQTNEVGRCAVLRSALATLPNDEPLRLIELGAAAGLNLAIDRYRIDYTGVGAVGPQSAWSIPCEVRGDRPPIGPLAPVTDRLGLDSTPLDLSDDEDRRWLRACVWADETERLVRLDQAIAAASDVPIALQRVDLCDDPHRNLLRVVDSETRTVVITSWTLAYLDGPRQHRVLEALEEVGRQHNDLVWICLESPDSVPLLAEIAPGLGDGDRASALLLSDWSSGFRSTKGLARCHPHGHWLDWRGGAG